MIDHFPQFAKIVQKTFEKITKDNTSVFVTDVDVDALYEAYLGAFPEGTNPTFKARTEHDCSCCKQFIRRIGAIVSANGGKITTVWSDAAASAPEPYRTVAKALDAAVSDRPICDLFRVASKERSFGNKQTISLSPTGRTLTWNHFFTEEVPSALRADGRASPLRGDRVMFAPAIDYQSPSTVLVEEEHQRNAVEGGAKLVLFPRSPATVAEEYDVNALLATVGDAFSAFDAVFVDDAGDVLHVYAIAADHDDAAYEQLGRSEEQLAGRRPGLVFEVHLRAARGRPVTAVAPQGTRQIHARR